MSEQTPPITSNQIDMDNMPEEEETELAISHEMADMIRQMAGIEEENAKLRNDALYAKAEVENIRRRMEQQIEERGKYAMSNFAKDILSVADNLRRALETVPADKRSEDTFLDTLAAGVELTERELLAIFERFGISQVPALNARFDPHVHQAMMEIDNPDVPSGTVTLVMQTGYVMHDRLLRPAMVGVSKGGPKPEAVENPEKAS